VLDRRSRQRLATLGAFVGMEIDVRRLRRSSLLVGGSVEAFVTLW